MIADDFAAIRSRMKQLEAQRDYAVMIAGGVPLDLLGATVVALPPPMKRGTKQIVNDALGILP
jgi:hypothetical protein